jgi:uncharacterized protein (TIGR01777 family)
MRILLSGASGFVGGASFHFLSQHHQVVRLCRISRKPLENASFVLWNPEEGRAERRDFEGFDAVIHLAGEPIFGFWTRDKKRRILNSRVVGTSFLAQVLTELKAPPKIFFSASAIGYYGDRGEEHLTETSSPGSNFLAEVCVAWEKASEPLEALGVRRILGRFGAVLGDGGMLAKLRLLYRLGLGGRLGEGSQWMSWIALDDLVRALSHCIEHRSIEGPVNFVSPHPIRQAEFSKWLAHTLHHPSLLALPAWLLKLLGGEAANEILLSSAYVLPEKLLSSGFRFQHPQVDTNFISP